MKSSVISPPTPPVSAFRHDIYCQFTVSVDHSVIVTVNDADKSVIFIFDDKEIVIIVLQMILYPAVKVL